MTSELVIRDKGHVEKINEIACKEPFEVWASTDTVMLDCRSLLGLYSLVGKKVHIVAEDYVEPKMFAKMISKMDK